MTRRLPGVALPTLAILIAFVAAALPAGGTATPAVDRSALGPSAELRSDLVRLVAPGRSSDPRLHELVPGHRPGELAYFVILDQPKTAAHRAGLERAGARILREYRTLDVFAVASRAPAPRRVAALPDVARLAPIEVMDVDVETEVDQSRATTADVGAPSLWNQGMTGAGVSHRGPRHRPRSDPSRSRRPRLPSLVEPAQPREGG